MKNTIPRENVLNVMAVLNNHTPVQLDVGSELHREVSDAIRILIECYAKRNDSRKAFEYYTIMMETFLTDYRKYSDDVFVWFIRELTNAEVCIRYVDVPMFKDIVTHYGPILREARSIKITPQELEEYVFMRNITK